MTDSPSLLHTCNGCGRGLALNLSFWHIFVLALIPVDPAGY